MEKNFNLSDLLKGDPKQSALKIRPHEKVMEEILGDLAENGEGESRGSKEKVNTILPDSKNS